MNTADYYMQALREGLATLGSSTTNNKQINDSILFHISIGMHHMAPTIGKYLFVMCNCYSATGTKLSEINKNNSQKLRQRKHIFVNVKILSRYKCYLHSIFILLFAFGFSND